MSKRARTLLVGATAFSVGFVLAMAFLLVGVYKVERLPSAAMAPGLPAGSTVAMGRHPGTVHGGEVVTFRSYGDVGESRGVHIARVIAVEGQTVASSGTAVTVDGKVLPEPYVRGATSAFGPVTVPAARLWVMGDSRENAADSRVRISNADHGTISASGVVGSLRFSGSAASVYGSLALRAVVVAVVLAAASAFVAVRTGRRSRTAVPA